MRGRVATKLRSCPVPTERSLGACARVVARSRDVGASEPGKGCGLQRSLGPAREAAWRAGLATVRKARLLPGYNYERDEEKVWRLKS